MVSHLIIGIKGSIVAWFSNTPSKMVELSTLEIVGTMEPEQSWFHRWFPFLQWSPSSPQALMDAESELLSKVKTKSEGKYVKVQLDERTNCNVWTRVFNPGVQDKYPLVMLHGMGAGLGLFAMNFDELSKCRTVYAIDLPGYARSSRCSFKSKPEEAEAQYVNSIESWRIQVGLDKFCLLGHSFGGYLSAAYALKHPERISHLILADPWGLPEKPKEFSRPIPIWIKILYHGLFKHLNPLAGLRLTGPWGAQTIGRMRPDLISKFQDIFENEEENKRVVSNYLYHSNVHTPSGESAFHSMMKGFAWAKNPMLPRLADLEKDISLTALYGADSWISAIPQEEFIAIRGVPKSDHEITNVEMIDNAGHHVYANAQLFNYQVNKACQTSDRIL